MASPLHPRNRHRQGYDFTLLLARHPALRAFVQTNPSGQSTINFHDPAAVKCLNRALLLAHYELVYWDIPNTYLCPAVPGRADYLHQLADLLAEDQRGKIARGAGIRALDIGTGANCVYPIIGSMEYGWSFVGTEVDEAAMRAAQQIIDRNVRLQGKVALRLQKKEEKLLAGVITADEYFELLLCNPPFYASAKEAAAATRRKQRGLGAQDTGSRNFGGQSQELWYPGGELAFVGKLIQESADHAHSVYWYTSLVARKSHLPPLRAQLERVAAAAVRVIPMAQGQKQSRILAWTFLSAKQRQAWRNWRW